MVVGMVAPMLAVQLMKRFDDTKPEFLLYLRGAYTAAVRHVLKCDQRQRQLLHLQHHMGV